MNLISILLIVTAILTVAVGVVAFFGSSGKERRINGWLTLTAIASAIWALSIAFFLGLPVGSEQWAPVLIAMIYASGPLTSPMALGFVSWRFKIGKVLTIISLAFGICLSTMVIAHPELLYSGYTISHAGNSVELLTNWFNFTYAGYFMPVITGFCVMSFYAAKKATSKRLRKGLTIFAVGILIEGICAGIFDVLLPLFVRYDLIWIGPLALAAVLLTFFYAALRYRMVILSSNWLKILASAVLLTGGVTVYMVLFYIIFTALFKIPNPSASILVLNFLMIVIVLLLMPVISELKSSISSMISVGQVDLAYVIKKLNKLASKNVNLRELAAFLADHLHFAYIGFVINGRLYGSKSLAMSADEINQVAKMRQASQGVWQEPNKSVQKIFDTLDLKAVAELKNAHGKVFGQMLVGKPVGKSSFERRDLIQLEMIINLVAVVIDSEKHLRA